MSWTGGSHTYADLSSSIGEKQAVKSTHESHIVKSKQKLKPVPEGMSISSSSSNNMSC